jgi:hypothetical protein
MSQKAENITQTHTSTMVVDRPWNRLHLLLFSAALLTSFQQPTAVQHFKSTAESSMSVTRDVVHSAIMAIHDEASMTRNKWMTLDAWKTVLHHYYDLDDEMGFSRNTLARAVKLFGAEVDFQVNGGNTTGVHLCLKSFVEHNKDGKQSGAQRVRFLLLSDSKETEPKEAIDISGWKRECKNSKAVIDKTSTLFVGIRALPSSFEDRAAFPGSLDGADLKISELRKLAKPTPRVVSPIQETVDANLAAPRTAAAALTATEDPPSQVDANVAARAAAAAAPPSQVDANVHQRA